MLFWTFDLQKKKKLRLKIENLDLQFCAEFNADSKTCLYFFLAFIVFDYKEPHVIV